MSSELILETPLGELKVKSVPCTETRTITFAKAALTISGVNVTTLEYIISLQDRQSPYIVRSFEKCLLDEPHNFECKDAKEIANRIADEFDYNKNPVIFNEVRIVLDDSASTWSVTISPLHKDKKSFKFQLIPDMNESKRCIWEIEVGAADDILVNAFAYVCLAAKHIHEEEEFITKMSLANG